MMNRSKSLFTPFFLITLGFFSSQAIAEKATWRLNYDSKPSFRTADWVDYLRLPFNPNQANPFSTLDTNVTSFDYGLYNPNLGGGHIARAAQHSLTYGNYIVGRQCLEQAIVNYLQQNGISTAPDKFFYQQGFWPMRGAGIVSGDSQLTKVSKALQSLHGGDLVYSQLNSNGPENGAQIVSMNCTLCHESRALVETCTTWGGCTTAGTKFKAVRNPWGSEGYISKNMKLMQKAVYEAVELAATGHSCANGPEKYIYAALYEMKTAKHNSTNQDGTTNSVDMSPVRLMNLTPDSSFYNPAGQVAHTVLNLLVNKDSWTYGKPSDIDQAYQMFRPEDVLFNNQFFPILNANFNQLYGRNKNGTTAPVNFSLNSAWSEKYYTPTENMFHGMGCSYIDEFGEKKFTGCDVVDKAALLAAATNSQGLNPDLSANTRAKFPGVPADYKWPLRKYSGSNQVFERTAELFIGLGANAGNPAVQDIINKRQMHYNTISRGLNTYNQRCADCHGSAQIGSDDTAIGVDSVVMLEPGKTDAFKFVPSVQDMPVRAYIANLRNQPYVPTDAVDELAITKYDGYGAKLFYGTLPDYKKLSVKNLVGIALEQRFGCYLNMEDFLKRPVPHAIQVTSSKFDSMKLGYVKTKTWSTHTATNETAAMGAAYPSHLVYWHKEHPECGALTTAGAPQVNQFYDAEFHGKRLTGSDPAFPALNDQQRKELIDFFIAISFDGTKVPSNTTYNGYVTIRLNLPGSVYNQSSAGNYFPYGVADGSVCDKSCAQFGNSCSLSGGAYMEGSLRKCCATKAAPQMPSGQVNAVRCGGVGPSYTSGYCDDNEECAPNFVCVARKCEPYVPPTYSPIPSPSPSPVVSPMPSSSPSPAPSPSPSPAADYNPCNPNGNWTCPADTTYICNPANQCTTLGGSLCCS